LCGKASKKTGLSCRRKECAGVLGRLCSLTKRRLRKEARIDKKTTIKERDVFGLRKKKSEMSREEKKGKRDQN